MWSQVNYVRSVYNCTDWLRPRNSLSPPNLGSYTRALLVSQDRRHLFVTPCLWSYCVQFLSVTLYLVLLDHSLVSFCASFVSQYNQFNYSAPLLIEPIAYASARLINCQNVELWRLLVALYTVPGSCPPSPHVPRTPPPTPPPAHSCPCQIISLSGEGSNMH